MSKTDIDKLRKNLKPLTYQSPVKKLENDGLLSSRDLMKIYQEKNSNNIFINIVIGELNRFAEELSRKKGDSPKYSSGKASRHKSQKIKASHRVRCETFILLNCKELI